MQNFSRLCFALALSFSAAGSAMADSNFNHSSGGSKTCSDFKERFSCRAAYKFHKLECRFTNNDCVDVFITKADECGLIQTQTRCEDAVNLYAVTCRWDGHDCKGKTLR